MQLSYQYMKSDVKEVSEFVPRVVRKGDGINCRALMAMTGEAALHNTT